MKVYLDIDGTMIHDDLSDMYCKAAVGLEDFLVALRSYDTYWLTTHCTTGDPTNARRIMKAVLPEELHADIDRIKPTVWQDLKTQGIDFNSDFIWFDNDIYTGEWDKLKLCSDNQTVIEVDLRNNPRHLIEITRDILS
jgi:hypothetical protein